MPSIGAIGRIVLEEMRIDFGIATIVDRRDIQVDAALDGRTQEKPANASKTIDSYLHTIAPLRIVPLCAFLRLIVTPRPRPGDAREAGDTPGAIGSRPGDDSARFESQKIGQVQSVRRPRMHPGDPEYPAPTREPAHLE